MKDLEDILGPEPKKTKVPVPPSPELTEALKHLLSRPKPAPLRPGRPTKEEAVQQTAQRIESLAGKMPSFEEIHKKGVPASLLAAFFPSLSEQGIRAKLAECPKIGFVRGNTPLYNFEEAASYLVKPRFNIKKLRKGDLPIDLQDDFWAAKLKEQKWREKAGELWSSTSVHRVVSETFLLIKHTVQLWLEDSRFTKFTDEQRSAFTELADGLQNEIYDALVKQAAEKMTESQLAELKAEAVVTAESMIEA